MVMVEQAELGMREAVVQDGLQMEVMLLMGDQEVQAVAVYLQLLLVEQVQTILVVLLDMVDLVEEEVLKSPAAAAAAILVALAHLTGPHGMLMAVVVVVLLMEALTNLMLEI